MKYKHYDITAAIIERNDVSISEVECGDCSQCCQVLSPNLTEEEFLSGKYIYTLLDIGYNYPVISVPKQQNGNCFYFKDSKCSIYDDRPIVCRQFDCRKGHYPPLKNLALTKFGEYDDEI